MTDYYPTNGTAPDSPAALFDNRIGLAEPDQVDYEDAERVDVFEGEVLAVVDHVDTARPFTDSDQDDAAESAEPTESSEPEDVTATFTWGAPDRAAGDRAPIIPPWLRSAEARKAAARQALSAAGYHTAFHAVRTPFYTVKTMKYSVIGAGRVTGKVTKWVRAEEGNYELRQKAAETNDAYTWQALNKIRERESRGRMWGLAIATAATLIVVAILGVVGVLAPVLWAALAALIVVTVRAGRPADKPILGRVATGRRFTKLTGDLVRNSLVSLAVRGITAPEQIEFCHPGIHRDGPGWLARVNLPEGVTAVKVLERRDGLASALRIPVDQVWPAAGPDHPGQLDLWVGYQPASEMGQPAWSLADDNARTSFFELTEFSSDERGRPVETTLFQRSYLIGGQPGSGKSFAGRALIAIAMLDPTCELKIAEFKGTGDFLDLEPLCSTYVVGVDEEALDQGVSIGRWLVTEAEKRGKRILAARKRGEAPLGKVTPELAAKPGSGLHPVCVLIDEAHELFAYSPDAGSDYSRAIKRLRALGICVILATQIPDKDSLPPSITRCVTNRWCLSVAGQVENDMILGTGAYKRGLTGTAYRPEFDAGWGCMTGGRAPVSARSQFPAPEVWDAMVARATSLRGGVAVGAPIETAPSRDLLADLTEVAASNGQHWEAAAEALVENWPDAYTHLTASALSDMARTAGLSSVDVKIAGTNRKGYRRADLNKLRAERDAEAQTETQKEG